MDLDLSAGGVRHSPMVNRINQLLQALDPVMSDNGGIKCSEEIVRVVALMRDMNKMESRCIYLNLILATKNEGFLKKFVNAGGWKIMNQWLADITSEASSDSFEKNPAFDSNLFIEDVLRALKTLPVSVDVLKQNATPRLVKSLSKDSKMSNTVQKLAGQVVELWMDVIKAQNAHKSNSSEKPHDSPSKSKDLDRSPRDSKTDKMEIKSEPKSPKSEGKNADKHPAKIASSVAPKLKIEGSVRKEINLFDIKAAPGSKPQKAKKRPSNESIDVKKMSSEKFATKSETSKIPDAKKVKLQEHLKVVNQPFSQSSKNVDILGQIKQSMEKGKAGVKTTINNQETVKKEPEVVQSKSEGHKSTQPNASNVPSKPKPVVRQISLCDDMFKPVEVALPSPVKKKKKIVSSLTAPQSKTVKVVKKTSESSSGKPSSLDLAASNAEVKTESSGSNSGNVSPGEKSESSEVHKGDDGKKRVKWRIDEELVLVKIYELDDEERAMKSMFGDRDSNAVDNMRDAVDITKREMLLERKIRQQQNYSASSTVGGVNSVEPTSYASVDKVTWKLIGLDLHEEVNKPRGHLSKEREVQIAREQQILPEVYPNLLTIPSSPREPELIESYRPNQDPVVIPYDDIEPQGMEIDSGAEEEDPVNSNSNPNLGQLANHHDLNQPNLAVGGLIPPVQTNQMAGNLPGMQSLINPSILGAASLQMKVDPLNPLQQKNALSAPPFPGNLNINVNVPITSQTPQVIVNPIGVTQNAMIQQRGNQFMSPVSGFPPVNNSVISPPPGINMPPGFMQPPNQKTPNLFTPPPFGQPPFPNQPFQANSFPPNSGSIGQRGASYDNGQNGNHNNGFGNQFFPPSHSNQNDPNFHQNQRNNFNARNQNNTATMLCKYFAQGKCHHGKTCRFSHDKKTASKFPTAPNESTRDRNRPYIADSRKQPDSRKDSGRKKDNDPRRSSDSRRDSDYRRDSPKRDRHRDSERSRDHRKDEKRDSRSSERKRSTSPKDSPKSKTRHD